MKYNNSLDNKPNIDWSKLTTQLVEEKNGNSIQAAINTSVDGAVIQLLPGDYSIKTALFISNSIWLKGAENGRTRLVLEPYSNCHILTNLDYHSGNQNIKISQIDFYGNASTQQRLPEDKRLLTCNAMYFKKVINIELFDLQVDRILHTGAHFNECVQVRIRQFQSSTVGWSGISTSGTSDIIIRDAYVYNSGLDKMHSGIHLDGGHGVYVEAKVESATGNGVMLDSNYAPLTNIVANCIISACKRGLALCGSGKHPLNSAYVTGHFHHNKEVGVLVSNASHISVIEALIENNAEYGVLLQGSTGSQYCNVSNCRLLKNGIPLAEIHQSKNNYFVLNHLEQNLHEPQVKNLLIFNSKTPKIATKSLP